MSILCLCVIAVCLNDYNIRTVHTNLKNSKEDRTQCYCISPQILLSIWQL